MRKHGLWTHEIWSHFYNLKFNNFLHKHGTYLHKFFATCLPMRWEHYATYRSSIPFTKKELCNIKCVNRCDLCP